VDEKLACSEEARHAVAAGERRGATVQTGRREALRDRELPATGGGASLADAGYRGVDKRPEAKGCKAQWRVAMKPSVRRPWRAAPRIG